MPAFTHLWALGIGAAAVALPIAIHFLTRPRPVRMPLSTIRFVQTAIRQQRARHRLRDFLVLAFRTAAVALAALAIARPLIGERPLVAADEPGHVNRVVLLDVSQSMAAQQAGVQLFERARTIAANYLKDSSDRRSNLILAGAAARAAFPRPTPNAAALRDDLANAGIRPERLNVPAALQLAGDQLLQSGPGERRELVIVSDFQRTNWAAADFALLPADAAVQLESVSPPAPLANLAVLQAGVPGRAEAGRDLRVEIEVGNFSPTPRQVRVEVGLGESTGIAEGLCPPNGKTTLALDLPSRGTGWLTGAARLTGVNDALANDDVRPIAVDLRPTPTFALLTRESAGQKSASSYYLERALSPLAPRPGRSVTKIVRMEPAKLERDSAADAELFALDHPGRLSPEAVRALVSLVRRGRGLLYVAAEAIDATNLKMLSDTAGSDLQMPVEFVPPPAGQRRRDLFPIELRSDRPPWTIFGESLPALSGTFRFGGGLGTRSIDGRLADDVLATLSDRSAGLVVSSCGSGTIAVLNANLMESNLVSSTAFVPLIGELTDMLLGRSRVAGKAVSGEMLAVPLPPAVGPAAALRQVVPDAAQPGELTDEGGGVMWRCPSLGSPGMYLVKQGQDVVYAVGVGLPAEESDLRTLDASVFLDRLAGGRQVSYRSAVTDSGNEQDRLWAWLAVACIGCLFAEVLTLKFFRT